MNRDWADNRSWGRKRIVCALLVLASMTGVMNSPDSVGAGNGRCGSDVDSEASLQTAVAAFVGPGTCNLIEITGSLSLTAPIGMFLGEPDVPEAIDKSLTIRGNGNVITGDGINGGFLIYLVSTRTLTIDNLGMTGFAGWGAMTLAVDLDVGQSAELLIRRSRFWNNNITTGDITGVQPEASAGAVNSHGVTTILDSEFVDNSGSQSGAFSNASIRKTTISGSTFARNDGSADAGAIFVGGDLELENSTISSNTAESHAAISAIGGVDLNFCTIVDNAGKSGDAIFVLDGALSVDNSIIYNNALSDTHSSAPPTIMNSLLTSSTSISVDHLVFTLTDPDTNVYGDPDLEPLGEYGGFELPGGTTIQTRPPRGKDSWLVIDKIEFFSLQSLAESTDQRGPGFSRTVNGLADMGAVELRPRPSNGRFRFDYTLPDVEPVAQLPSTR